MHRVYVPDESFREPIAKVKGEEFKHLANVLRLKPGDSVCLFDGKGREFQGTIKYLDKDQAGVQLGQELVAARESPLRLWLVQGLPKGDKMELIIQKASELGAAGVVPLEAERSIVRLEGRKKEERRERWQRVAVEAIKQCRRTVVPQVELPISLKAFLQGLPADRLLLIPWEEGGRPLKAVLNDPLLLPKKDQTVYVLIGPEGGWEAGEVALAAEYGAIAVSLGPRILRTETAGLAAISALMYQWGDLGE